ncbi:DUF6545 domain-containing protein [Micromonospora sp. NPDC005324]|uniref:DUF6545 domain-containing protein n=1 Tax=Micromonospora sp. NPDC005324 TaxID=3157033 RepID=UPI0033A3EF02
MIFARAQVARRLRNAGVPPPCEPYTVHAWCEAIGQTRGRPLKVHAVRLGTHLPPGVIVARNGVDHILVDAAMPALAFDQSVLHELGHYLLDHDGDVLNDHVDPDVEAEAELAADLLYEQLMRAAASATRPSTRTSRILPLMRLPGRPSAWWADRSNDWHVHRLWMTLRTGMPDAVIISTSTGVQVAVEAGGSRQRHRTVIEVHEALRVLRPYCSPLVHASATRRAQRHGLDDNAVAAIAEAATLAVALRRRQASLPPEADDPPLQWQRRDRHDLQDVRAEARRLAAVARALHDSPLVAAEIARCVPVVAGRNSDALPRPRMVADTPLFPLGAARRGRSASTV